MISHFVVLMPDYAIVKMLAFASSIFREVNGFGSFLRWLSLPLCMNSVLDWSWIWVQCLQILVKRMVFKWWSSWCLVLQDVSHTECIGDMQQWEMIDGLSYLFTGDRILSSSSQLPNGKCHTCYRMSMFCGLCYIKLVFIEY